MVPIPRPRGARVVDGAITVTLTGGSSARTEQNTFRKWDYRAKDDFFSRLDEATQSTVTTRSGADGEGNPSLSQSIVNERKSDFISQTKTVTPYGTSGSFVDAHTVSRGEAEIHSQTASSSGPSDNRRQNLVIDRAFESYDETADVEAGEDSAGNDHVVRFGTEIVSRTDKTDRSNYRSTHLVDKNGLARDGEFTASSRSTVTSTDPKYFDPQRGSFSRVYNYEYFGPEYYGGEQYSIAETEETAGLESQVTTTTSESGSYCDVPLSSTYAVRVQSGDYKIDQRSRLDDFYTFDYFYHEDFGISGWSTADIDSTDQKRNVSQDVTTGSYGTWGIEEQRDFRNTYAEELYVRDLRRDNAGYRDKHDRSELLINNDNGVFSGREYERHWGTYDPPIYDPNTGQYVSSYNHVVTDRDLFAGTPPSGPVGGNTYVVHSPPGEQTGGGTGGEEQQGGFRPGTIDAKIDVYSEEISPHGVIEANTTTWWERIIRGFKYRKPIVTDPAENPDAYSSDVARMLADGYHRTGVGPLFEETAGKTYRMAADPLRAPVTLAEETWEDAKNTASLPFVWDELPDYQKRDIAAQLLSGAAFGQGTATLRGAKPVKAAENVRWIDDNPAMSQAARNYEDAATGARSSIQSKIRQVPVIERNGRPVKFDGLDGEVLIDRKRAVTTFDKSKQQALRQSEALRESGLTGRWEVPNAAEVTRARKMFEELGIDNIVVEVVP